MTGLTATISDWSSWAAPRRHRGDPGAGVPQTRVAALVSVSGRVSVQDGLSSSGGPGSQMQRPHLALESLTRDRCDADPGTPAEPQSNAGGRPSSAEQCAALCCCAGQCWARSPWGPDRDLLPLTAQASAGPEHPSRSLEGKRPGAETAQRTWRGPRHEVSLAAPDPKHAWTPRARIPF